MENENVMADKINDGSPFGIIFIIENYNTIDRRAEKLRSILECKKECNFIWFIESRAIIHNTPKVFERESPSDLIQYSIGIRISEITAFVVFTNESDTIFNLKNYLGLSLLLATLTTLLILTIKLKN